MHRMWLLWPEGCPWVPFLARGITCSFRPVSTLHFMMVQSLAAEKMARSSGVMTKHVMESWWPRKTRMSVGAGAWISFATDFCNLPLCSSTSSFKRPAT